MLTMLLLLSSAFTVMETPVLGQVACGTRYNPCRVVIDGTTEASPRAPDAGSLSNEFSVLHNQMTASAVDNSECMRALKVANDTADEARSFAFGRLLWALVATIIAMLSFWANWKNIFAAWRQAELRFTLPAEFKQFIVLLMCPFAFGVAAAALVKVGATFTGDSPRWIYWGAMAVAVFLGGGFGYDWAQAIERRSLK